MGRPLGSKNKEASRVSLLMATCPVCGAPPHKQCKLDWTRTDHYTERFAAVRKSIRKPECNCEKCQRSR